MGGREGGREHCSDYDAEYCEGSQEQSLMLPLI